MEKIISVLMLFLLFSCSTNNEQETEIQYLTGTGYGNTVEWDFFCTDGRRSGEWTKIEVPSHWEQQGFGSYNYGYDNRDNMAREKGFYKTSFTVPSGWDGKKVNIVFEGSMTDTEVKVNGTQVGPVHMGSFYRFKYDITSHLHFEADNLLDVTVAKHSENMSVNEAERFADYWIFGGIYRPVYLEAVPVKHIEHFAVDARADGNICADLELNDAMEGDLVKLDVFDLANRRIASFKSPITDEELYKKQICGMVADVKPWSPEFPNLYNISISLISKTSKEVFSIRERIGFRTVELRKNDGIYLNGLKIKFKGVCRHSHWPESGRTTNKEISILDVNLMKQMNMNAVRMSHYPPDKHFLEVCDSLGLMVLDELAGWGEAYDTVVGAKLARETVRRDVNHPSVVMWCNGNEEGWTLEVVKYFDREDPQKRPVILPSADFRGTDTQHYEDYDYGNGTHHHGRNIVFPTEFLHGQFDGGGGAGLEDYWKQMWDNPLCAGGFLWDFADEAIVRTDLNDSLDHDRNHAADGIVGPHREKEASFYTIKEIWAPVFFERKYITPEFDGAFNIENRYHFTNLDQCRFSYMFVDLAGPSETHKTVLFKGEIAPVNLSPGMKGIFSIDLPVGWAQSDVLLIKAVDPHGMQIFEWSWPVKRPAGIADAIIAGDKSGGLPEIEQTVDYFILTSGSTSIFIDKNTGLLDHVEADGIEHPFGKGPILLNGAPQYEGVEVLNEEGEISLKVKFTHGRDFYTGNYKSLKWTMRENGWLRMDAEYWPTDSCEHIGVTFSLPEENVKGIRYMGQGPYRVWKNRLKGGTINVWEKEYNNTITGESYDYPEFKGYYKDFYWAQFLLQENTFTVLCASEDVFLRLLTPDPPVTRYSDVVAPAFPEGDISFLHGINPIGTKFKEAYRLGPMSQDNYYKHYRYFNKELTLYFNFDN